MTDKSLISPAELESLAKSESCVIIDTRAPDAFAAGHVPGAVNLHDIFTYLATSSPEGIVELRDKFAEEFGSVGLSGAETAVIYEQSMNTGFGQSCRGYFLLQYLGYPKIKVLHGGYAAWTEAGLPVSTEAAAPEPKTFPMTDTGKDLMMDAAAMLDAVKDAAVVKLDVRDIDEWIAGKLFSLWQGLLPAQGPDSGCQVAGVVPDDEADPRQVRCSRARKKCSPNARPSASRRTPRLPSTASRARAPRTPTWRSRKPA